ncbi:PREDICTED: F-box/kelch-repeat protein At1g24800-like [Camelina sativa]|uniref:F-box/kelch-repeat protein At1g24800-like n=1 Tax=Camelina sativa TaxID=90675 RepID=A0ABM1RBI5_CAMSA|nr:PREDICTED: F-box/kelch-repeat protein At1g24800-like [Camelina sativa]
MSKRICDLPPEVVGDKILAKVPITSLAAVRSTSKLWHALSKDWIVGKAAASRQNFLGFMTMDSKVCSVRFHLRRKEEEDSVDLSIKQVALLDQVEVSTVFHCGGLLLCVLKDNSRLLAWNPYLGQTRWIGPNTSFHRLDRYALGYDIDRNHHKILRFVDNCIHSIHYFGFEIYDFGSNSWRVLDVRPDWEVEFYQRGVSLKGNA